MISIWCDFIERSFLQGEFKELVAQGKVQGATSNPSIFAQALKSESYHSSINELKQAGKKPKEIYETLAIEDIKMASQILMPLFLENPQNGLISIEIDPFLSNDINASIDEGVRLWHEINAKNVMIKVPATQSGYTIMEHLMLRGINVNATLVFTKEQSRRVLQAFQKANTQAQGVISVFVSRFDRAIDLQLKDDSLRGKYGIANAIAIYKDFLSQKPQQNYRILFASTGVKEKNAIYNDEGYYVYPLAFENCVNTLPLQTLHALQMQNLKAPSMQQIASFDDLEIAASLEEMDINLVDIEEKLLQEGLKSFETSFNDMLNSLA
ncbi:transaldolase [Helicobacter trogontum]|uniref:Transaldolase n=1 Tax=Helicobacter trogontum TaxID=50960 RepID=A0A099VEW6_9HELI|nr:transaldolase [Helicobacter trogontum]MCI5786520.1 transaldolase [Helicobacter trogontum]MDY5184598.1 transaldolase [Helicobacter trogontum]TLD81447.1 transaldolase [Helicobacter trogontum]TLD98092.1 transaldolase [Helicobacter trogontum]